MKKILILIIAGLCLMIAAFIPKKVAALDQDNEVTSQASQLLEEDEEKRRFNLSGFLDFQYQHIKFRSDSSALKSHPIIKDTGHFRLNNFNVYLLFNISNNLQAFGEVRYLFIPTGQEDITSVDVDNDGDIDLDDQFLLKPFDNVAYDNMGAALKYGSIFIERVYMEWNAVPYASLRLGRYLTPFGIWSQDHGAPIITSIRVPMLVNSFARNIGMPVAQTGIELFGKVHLRSIDVFVDYAAYIGNGVSESESIFDNEDKNKAFGGFLNFSSPFLANNIDVEFGVSGYRGARTFLYKKELTPSVHLSTSGIALSIVENKLNNKYYYKQMDTIALAHLKISISSLPLKGIFIFQAEGMKHWIDEDEGETRMVTWMGAPRLSFDQKFDAYYLQTEYQFFGRITPYFRYEWCNLNTKDSQLLLFFNEGHVYIAGLNIKPLKDVLLKAEWVAVKDAANPFNISNDMYGYNLSAVISF